jgi:hypothetical protein
VRGSTGGNILVFGSIYGVDFSGAKLAGRNTWVARMEPAAAKRKRPRYVLTSLVRLEQECGSAERSTALSHLVRMIADSDGALWALDFPFGLPIELMECDAGWPAQFDLLHAWGHDDYGVGLECVRRALALGFPKHVRRLTDVEAKAPFDPYHYRIIYQTFYGMRDVLGPLRRRRHTAILPFQYRRLRSARRVLVEACPGEYVRISDTQRRVIMRNGGGDALDAVIAAVGAARAWQASDHRLVARHPRYPREGRLFV